MSLLAVVVALKVVVSLQVDRRSNTVAVLGFLRSHFHTTAICCWLLCTVVSKIDGCSSYLSKSLCLCLLVPIPSYSQSQPASLPFGPPTNLSIRRHTHTHLILYNFWLVCPLRFAASTQKIERFQLGKQMKLKSSTY